MNCNLSSVGSLLNNSIPNLNTNKNKKYIIFLSQYKDQSSQIRTNENKIVDQNLTYHEQRKHVLKIVSDFCYKNKFVLKIFPRSFNKKEWSSMVTGMMENDKFVQESSRLVYENDETEEFRNALRRSGILSD